jgi:hypothetical protein
MICSTLTGKMSILHPFVKRFVREDGMILNRVRSMSKKCNYTKGFMHHNGYYCIRIGGTVYSVHRLIAEVFIPNKRNVPFVDHINRNRSDNRATNLRWVTAKENIENSSIVINRNPFISVRRCESRREYEKQLRHLRGKSLNMIKPDGTKTAYHYIPEWLYKRLKPLSLRDRFLEYISLKNNHQE